MRQFTLSDKVGGVAALGIVGGCCGPGLFILFSLVIYLLVSIPFAIFSSEPPDWMILATMIVGAVLTVLFLLGMVVHEMDERKKKELIKAAELKRAERELGGDAGQ